MFVERMAALTAAIVLCPMLAMHGAAAQQAHDLGVSGPAFTAPQPGAAAQAVAPPGQMGSRPHGSPAIGGLPPVVPPVVPPPPPSAGEPIPVPTAAPSPGVLHEISQRQTELAILELDIKKAELQKKLRDLESGNAPVPPPVPVAANGPAIRSTGEGALPPAASGAASVRRIHKAGKALVALISFPGGDARTVRRGDLLPDGSRVTEILPDAVFVRGGEEAARALPGPLPAGGQ